MPALLISVRFHDGRYHGSGEWPPSPARLFQALVAGAARGENLSESAVAAFKWLENLDAAAIAVPPAYAGQPFKNFVPNNDLDAVGGDPARIGEIRAGKIVRPRMFDAAIPLLYAWAFAPEADAEYHARTICEIANNLYQLGRGVDMAWATGEVVDEREVDSRLCPYDGVLWRPSKSGDGTLLSCPRAGSLVSLTERFKAMRGRFRRVGERKKARLLFSQASKPNFMPVPYNSASTFLLFDIRKEDGKFAPQPLERAVALTENVRDLAVKRLKASAWRRDDPKRETLADKIFIGRDSQESDKARRVRIAPLPSIGHAQTERSIRRVLVAVSPDCPIATGDIAWAFSGLPLADPKTGEVRDDTAELVAASDDTMLAHYGIEDTARLWQTVTPATLPERAARRRINPRRAREEAKRGVERVREHAAAEWAVRQALRHTGVNASVQGVRVQREPFEGKGLRAEAFAKGTRFAKERLWHVEVGFARPITGPLLIGDGRYIGLGLMRPVQRIDGIFTFAITGGLTEQADFLGLTRALRRAVIARVQEKVGARATLPSFFTGHAADGAPSRSGRHKHLAFAFDAPRKRLLIVAPHVLERRQAFKDEREQYLPILANALEDFRELRAGTAGKLALTPSALDLSDDPLLALSQTWQSLTPYRVTRHARLNDAAAALEADLLLECQRAGLPRPQIEIAETFMKRGAGLFGLAKLRFYGATAGPMLLGRDRHFGGGLFVTAG
ncbi:MAG TPA: type I-U CRISPR-associated protein Csb2 [Rhizomicrobium sp.]|nr:type I-U CRISPR-associated protein Csb2 [Rhizomicrobium sp.]